MRDDRSFIHDLKSGLQSNIRHLVATYCPGGIVDGDLYWALNPQRGDRRIGSFNIRLRANGRNEAGMFHDFAAPEYSGDVLDFVSVFVLGKMPGAKSRGDAIRWARDYLGLSPTERLAPELKKGTVAQKPQDTRDLAAKQKRARDLWIHKAAPLAPGHPVWRYLRDHRQIPLDELEHLPRATRMMDKVRHTETDTFWPCMVNCMVDARGVIRAVHRTFLDDEGRKAPLAQYLKNPDDKVPPVKKMWPSAKGLVIPVHKGKSGLSAGKAAEAGLCDDRVVLHEGYEDALCWHLLYPDDRVLAVGSLSNFANAPIYRCADELLIVRDRFGDASERDGFDSYLDKLASRISQAGQARGWQPSLNVSDVEPYKDVNDMWRAVLNKGAAA